MCSDNRKLPTQRAWLSFALLGLVLTTASNAWARSETLRWTEGPSSPVSAHGFKIHVGKTPGVYSQTFDVGLSGGANSDGIYKATLALSPTFDDSDIYMVVTAYDASPNNESDFSNEKLRPGQNPVSAKVYSMGFSKPKYATAPAGDSRLFVMELGGKVKILTDAGTVNSTPFIDIAPVMGNCCLVSLAFDPNYASNGFFYTSYRDTNGETTLSRWEVSSNPDVADPQSELVLLVLPQPYSGNASSHIAFGPEGFLFMATGDGGGTADPDERSQDPQSLHGKVLRLDVTTPKDPNSIDIGEQYWIPWNNPFVNNAGTMEEIWAFGVRNPFRFSFDRSSGDLWMADLGITGRDEVNFESSSDPGGHNYGWDVEEGSLCNTNDPAPFPICGSATLTDPIYEYDQTNQDSGIVGGFVYRGAAADLKGEYLFTDEGSGLVYGYEPATGIAASRMADFESAAGSALHVKGFGQGGDGELWLITDTGTLIAVPEPSEAFLQLGALLAIGALRRRSNRASA